LREQIVGDAHLHVVGFADKNHDRFILRFPAKARDRASVAAAIGDAADAKFFANLLGCVVAFEDLAILDAVENPETI
jgi:hypothetical protein